VVELRIAADNVAKYPKNDDNKTMRNAATLSGPQSRHLFSFFFFLFSLGIPLRVSAYPVQYKEQYYRLYHLHHIQYPDDTMENIVWLEQAIKAPFANPLWANALIENETEYEKYRALFMMHLNLKLIEQYIYLGNKWNKRNAYFYNAPWKDENLDSLDTAETCFRTALFYWNDAKTWAGKANERRFRFINLQRVQFWEDEAFRMEAGSLNYEKTLTRELALLQTIREKFQQME
jgi:hypothetical protein